MKILKTTFKYLKMIGLVILGLLIVLIIAVALFMNLSPQFGGTPTKAQKEKFATSAHYVNGKFQNPVPTSMDMKAGDYFGLFYEFFKGGKGREPEKPLPVQKIDSMDIVNTADSVTKLTWFGHSTFLLEVADKKVLIDPMFGNTPAPTTLFGPYRFTEGLPIAIEQLPVIDAVMLSHDHYDHLDYGSIQQLKDKVGAFYVPLGVGAHLLAWGVEADKINEMDWWESANHESLTFISTPARHFSGRGFSDRFNTLWCGWIIKQGDTNIYFSGDSGYGPHFKEIGDKYGPFNFAMLECGQYNELWKDIHMMPEETAQAAVDLKADLMMPIHWGAFRLAYHTWDDPIVRVTKKAAELNMPITTPQIGQPITIGVQSYPSSEWWKNL